MEIVLFAREKRLDLFSPFCRHHFVVKGAAKVCDNKAATMASFEEILELAVRSKMGP